MNKYLNTIVIAPLTSNLENYPSRIIIISQNNKNGSIVLDQVRTIDKQGIIKVLGRLSEKEILKTKLILKEIFVD